MDVTWFVFRQLCLISIPTFRASDLRVCVRLRCTKLMVKFSLFVTSTGREEAVQIHVGIYRKTKDHFKKLSKSCYKILEEFFWLLTNIIYAYTFYYPKKYIRWTIKIVYYDMRSRIQKSYGTPTNQHSTALRHCTTQSTLFVEITLIHFHKKYRRTFFV